LFSGAVGRGYFFTCLQKIGTSVEIKFEINKKNPRRELVVRRNNQKFFKFFCIPQK
jgi:hypothetical protein